eukprot:SAG11_NODE_6683_length_1267_cov_0.936644_1_plen_45_part_10
MCAAHRNMILGSDQREQLLLAFNCGYLAHYSYTVCSDLIFKKFAL